VQLISIEITTIMAVVSGNYHMSVISNKEVQKFKCNVINAGTPTQFSSFDCNQQNIIHPHKRTLPNKSFLHVITSFTCVRISGPPSPTALKKFCISSCIERKPDKKYSSCPDCCRIEPDLRGDHLLESVNGKGYHETEMLLM
jgi:hypothetical protein